MGDDLMGDDLGTPGGPMKRTSRSGPPTTPRWVGVLGGIGIAVVAVFVIAHLTGIVPTGGHLGP